MDSCHSCYGHFFPSFYSSITFSFLSLVSLWTYYITLYTSRTTFCTLYINPMVTTFDSRDHWTLHFQTYSCTDTRTILDTGYLFTVFYLYVCTHNSASPTTSNARCSMQPPIDIPLPRQTSFHSLDSSVFVGSPSRNVLGELSIDSITPASSSRNTVRSRRLIAPNVLPSGSQPSRRPSEYTRQWSLFGQLMEIEGLPGSIGSIPSPNSDGNILVHEQVARSPGLSPRTQLSSSFHTQYSTEPASCDAPFPIHPITNNHEPDSLSSSAASLDAPSRPTQSYLPFRPLTFTNTHRNVLKCAIAYFIASLFTFSPHLSRFISDLSSYGPNDPTTPSPSGHMVATMYGA